eukprot:CAMPEP_0114512650 /NCGR_PEP_ID=MMETSP0109-20121206/15100_1 /TAXON_ID=29199 /ORGANISM="Chlorarachnion reptans, Strain CCCM449" /LENGTH=326 /DNA_ID=CAMNT_0001692371 /DNA_START=65 /DNA_END=1045 /DNA_ORIENTATION=-
MHIPSQLGFFQQQHQPSAMDTQPAVARAFSRANAFNQRPKALVPSVKVGVPPVKVEEETPSFLQKDDLSDGKAESEHSISGAEDTENEFPSLVGKTYDMVDDPRTDKIICWAEDGNGFIVRDPEAFCSQILPTYFRTKRFRSFVRNLNMYGFRSRKQAQQGVYRFRHPQFRRYKKNLLTKIRKKTTQKSILSDLRGAIKDLQQNYIKLAKSQARIETVLTQITQALPMNIAENVRRNLANPAIASTTPALPAPATASASASESNSKPSEIPVAKLAEKHEVDSNQMPDPLSSMSFKLDGDGFGSASPLFNLDNSKQFSWSMLGLQA